jgi:CDP-glycerol glycerophosphotransferase (TagB/SpsB family)
MPTWRRYLVGEVVGAGMKRDPMDDFQQSGYALAWQSFLRSERLRQLAEKHDKKIVFCPHPNMAMYLESWELPDYIRCRDPRRPPSLQETFAEAALLVTDYSSVAFECAYIDKPIVYYQFDRNEFFAGEHVCTGGHFMYEMHGFGPVTETLNQTFEAVGKVLQGNEGDEYHRRRKNFFAFHDGRCCERVCRELVALLPRSKALNKKIKEDYRARAQPGMASLTLTHWR